jgi:hypothetical protein
MFKFTLKEFADKYLCPPVRERFIKNCHEHDIRNNIINDTRRLCSEERNLHVFIAYAFNGEKTPEGLEYWYEIERKLRDDTE